MPGFKFQGLDKNDVNIDISPVYNYAWQCSSLIGTMVQSSANPLIYLKTCTLPSYSCEVESIPAASGISYKYAKGINWEDVKFTFYDTKGLGKKLKDFTDKIWTSKDGVQKASVYKDTTIIKALLPDDSDAMSWTLYGSWIKSVNYSDLSYADEGVHEVSVVVAYDYAESE